MAQNVCWCMHGEVKPNTIIKGVGRGVRGVRTNPPLGDNKNKLTGILHV